MIADSKSPSPFFYAVGMTLKNTLVVIKLHQIYLSYFEPQTVFAPLVVAELLLTRDYETEKK